ncbi:Na+/H+ antiporter NhaC [Bacillus sp. EAC]|uniref:Na+/H+ antiporter NhaC n=1 Tax=Bacillus sp. EAC TaxID=1978338 RepID=UPI000B43AFAA|nr:Na+/H+ antiporter NhaC [Bacillus sp. EAC]
MKNIELGALIALFTIIMSSCLVILNTEPHIPLLLCVVCLSIFGLVKDYKWNQLEDGMKKGIQNGLSPTLILMMIGLLIGSWMLSGTVPTLLYFGISVLSAKWFAVSSIFITIIVASFTGSTFTTIGTVGVALMGIAHIMGIPPAIAAGAIICGACFGDKMSPISDTTNFVPSILGIKVNEHIRHMAYTTIPALIVTVILFLIIGMGHGNTDMAQVMEMKKAISANFEVNPILLIPCLIVFIMAFKGFSTLPTMSAGIVSSLILAFIIQKGVTLDKVFTTLQSGFQLDTNNEMLNSIINRGGLQSMMWSVSLIFIALALGGLLQELRVFDKAIESLTNLKRKGNIVIASTLSSIGVNLLTGEQYLSILLPGQLLKDVYIQKDIPLKNLSRALEDGGTLFNPIVPWSVSGAFFAATLGVPVLEYLPFSFILFITPLFSMLAAVFGKGLNHENEIGDSQKIA